MVWTTVLRKSMSDLMLNGVTKTSLASSLAKIRKAVGSEIGDTDFAQVEKYLRNVYKSADKRSVRAHFRQKEEAADSARAARDADEELSPEQERALQEQVPIFTKSQLSFRAQELLDIKIRESVNLIKMNREASINRTLQRFQGWATALPPTGQLPKTMEVAKRTKVGTKLVRKSDRELAIEAKRKNTEVRYLRKFKEVPTYETKFVRKKLPTTGVPKYERLDYKKEAVKIAEPISSLRYKERRVAIDQGHKLNAAIAEVTAYSNNAIGFTWRHNYSKNPRPDHQELDGTTLPYRNSWAVEQGLVRGAPEAPHYIEQLPAIPAQEINCRCAADYITSLRELYRRAPHLLTKKGLAVLGIK